MSKILRSIRHHVYSDPHLGVAFAAGIIVLLWETLHKIDLVGSDVSPTAYLFSMMICIFSLVVDRFKGGKQNQRNSNKLAKIYQTIFDKKAALYRHPRQAQEYDNLWGGYTGRYYVYNPAYTLDVNVGEEDVVKIFLHRYRNPLFEKAQYLFLTGDESGKAALAKFCSLMNKVQEVYPKVRNKVEIKELKEKKAISVPEMYLGKRNGEPVVVLEIKESVLELQHGKPYYYLVSHDAEVNEHCCSEFDKAWNDSKASTLENFRISVSDLPLP
jgi:hypothetical protein